MFQAKNSVRRFLKDEEGAALAEYGLLVALIAIAAVTALGLFGKQIVSKFTQYTSTLQAN